MNKKIKDCLNNTSQVVSSFLGNLGKTFSSLLRICVLSSAKVARQSKCYSDLKLNKSCCVLGTGPSLKEDFENGRVLTVGNDIMCVNMFCSSPLFKVLKPRFYYLVDGAYFTPKTDRHKQMVDNLISVINEVDWDMYIVVSSSAVSGSKLLKSIDNKYVKVIRVNSAEFDGFRYIRHWVYRHRLGMPRCQTVVNLAICTAINLQYDNIYLYGVDHTWTRDLFVDEDNVVCYGDRHVYNKDLTIIKKEGNFARLLDAFSNMFKSHYLIEEYAQSLGIKIWNCSSDSYLDAYQRMKK